MTINRSLSSFYVTLLAFTLSFILSGCASLARQEFRLRIINDGSYAITNLVVRFPEDRILFGNIPVGLNTVYMEVPNGVFRYAAYEFEIDGKIITQPVIDWVGENPMDGNLFTYTIDFDPSRVATGDQVRLIDVKKDD